MGAMGPPGRGQGAHEMTGSRPDAEADKCVKLIWIKDVGAMLRGQDEAEESVEEAKACNFHNHSNCGVFSRRP